MHATASVTAASFPPASCCRSSSHRERSRKIPRGTLEAARIDWSNPGAPVSTRYGDVYYAAAGGLEETRHVFLAGNNLPAAWRDRRTFTIGETGFGTGLNFLATWDLWQRTASPAARLQFVSVEGYPLTLPDLERAHCPFRELAPLARKLRDIWPHLYGGFHRLHFDEDRVTLTLLFGEAGEMLDALDARMDAWFLDGFSPAKNPDLWRREILDRIGALTRPGGTASSFTVAGAVRHGLDLAGFEVEKAPGFGRKRHMLRAQRRSCAARVSLPTALNGSPADPPTTALIVGAGLAGSTAARALIRRHVNVTLIDPDPHLKYAASGNPAGIASPRPAADSSPAGRFHCAAFDYAQRHFLRNTADFFSPCGVLELATNPQALRRFERLAAGDILPESALRALSGRDASAAAGIDIPAPALLFPRGGLVRPTFYAEALRGTIEVRQGRVDHLTPSNRGWTARLNDGSDISADFAVLACGIDAAAFVAASAIPVTASRGQLSLVPISGESRALKKALSFGGYISPAFDGEHVLGATYDDVRWPPDENAFGARESDHTRNFKSLTTVLPDFPITSPGPGWRARVAFRCTTPDRLPLCGPVPEPATPQSGGGNPLSSLPIDRKAQMSYKEGLILYTGLGSRGLSTAPLLGELLASLACGDPLPTERVVTELLHPARFLVRARKKAGFSAQF